MCISIAIEVMKTSITEVIQGELLTPHGRQQQQSLQGLSIPVGLCQDDESPEQESWWREEDLLSTKEMSLGVTLKSLYMNWAN